MATIIADIPIPSIEHEVEPEAVTGIRSTREGSTDEPPTPPTPSTPSTTGANGPNPGDGDASAERPIYSAQGQLSREDHLTNGISNLRLSPPAGALDMNGLAQAIAARPERANSLTPSIAGEGQVPGSARARRRSRRASSQVGPMRHEVSEEPLPPGAVHSPEFRHAFQTSKRLMSNMEAVLRSSTLHTDEGSTIHRLHREATGLAGFQYPSTRIVGFVGDSGVGKSSLLNSLLDKRALARTSNSGEACTCVVTEYHYHAQDTFDIKTDLFTVEELSNQLRPMIQSYRYFQFHGDEMEEEDRRDMELKADLAIDTFRAMFRGRLQDEEFLVNDSEDIVTETLSYWIEEFRPLGESMQHSQLSLEQCSTTLVRLSSEVTATSQPAAWPYIKNIKVFSNAHILSTGLILVDLPGLRDLNSARRIITERYLLRCDEIFAICNIGRAITDEGVHNVFELARQARLSNVGIICTRSEDIQAEEALVDSRGARANAIRRMMDAIAADYRDAKSTQQELDEFDDDDDLSDDEREEYLILTRRRDQIRRRQKGHKFELQDYLVSTRNEHVSEQLQDTYGTNIQDEQIRVFCVSNTTYWDNRDSERSIFQPYLRMSGILSARKHCMSIVANSQRREAMRYMNNRIPAFIAQVELWIQSGARSATQERREMVLRALDEVEEQMSNDLSPRNSSTNRFATEAKQLFVTHVYDRKDIPSWSRQAAAASSDWSGHRKATYSAFCRNYGNHYTQAVGDHNWNEEASNAMVSDMEVPWEGLCAALQQVESDIVQDLDELMDNFIDLFAISQKLRKRAEASSFAGSDIPTALIDTLSTQQRIFLDSIEQSHEQLESDLSRLRIRALSGIQSSFIGQAMEPSYRRCNLDSGRGSDGRRKGVIGSTLRDQLLFRTLMRDFKAAFGTHISTTQDQMCDALNSYLRIARENFDVVRSENAIRESEMDPEFRDRLEETVDTSRAALARVVSTIA